MNVQPGDWTKVSREKREREEREIRALERIADALEALARRVGVLNERV